MSSRSQTMCNIIACSAHWTYHRSSPTVSVCSLYNYSVGFWYVCTQFLFFFAASVFFLLLLSMLMVLAHAMSIHRPAKPKLKCLSVNEIQNGVWIDYVWCLLDLKVLVLHLWIIWYRSGGNYSNHILLTEQFVSTSQSFSYFFSFMHLHRMLVALRLFCHVSWPFSKCSVHLSTFIVKNDLQSNRSTKLLKSFIRYEFSQKNSDVVFPSAAPSNLLQKWADNRRISTVMWNNKSQS